MPISRSSLFYSISTLSASNLLLHALAFLWRILLSRLAGAEAMGVYQLVAPAYSVIHAATILGPAIVCESTASEVGGMGARIACERCIRLFFIFFTLVAVPTFLFSKPICQILLGDIRARNSLLLFLPCLFCTGIENIIKNYFYGTNRLKEPILSELSEQCVRIVSMYMVFILFTPNSVADACTAIVCGTVISEIASSVFLSLCLKKSSIPMTVGTPPPGSFKLMRRAIPISMAGVINNLISSAHAVLLPRRLMAFGMDYSCALEEMGTLFGMTAPLIMLPIAFISPLNTITLPVLSRLKSQGQINALKRKAGKTLHAIGILAFPAISLFLFLGRPIARSIYTSPGAGAHMLPMCIAAFFTYYAAGTASILNGVGKERFSAITILLSGIIDLIFTYLTGNFGIRAFLAGHIISSFSVALLNLMVVCRTLKITLRIRNWFVSPLLSAFSAGISAQIVYKFSSSLFLAIAVGGLIYSLTMTALGTRPVKYFKGLITQ